MTTAGNYFVSTAYTLLSYAEVDWSVKGLLQVLWTLRQCNVINPGLDYLSKLSGMTQRQLLLVRKKATEAELLVVSNGNGSKTSVYKFTPKAVELLAVEGQASAKACNVEVPKTVGTDTQTGEFGSTISVSNLNKLSDLDQATKINESCGASTAAVAPAARVLTSSSSDRTEPAVENSEEKIRATDEVPRGTSTVNSAKVDDAANIRRAKALVAEQQARGRTEQAEAVKQAKRARKAERQEEQLRMQRERAAEEGLEPKKAHGYLRDVWLAEFTRAFPSVPASKDFGPQQWGQLQLLLKLYDPDQIEASFVFTIRNWAALRKKFWKGGGGPTPGVGVVLRLHESIVPAASIWCKHAATLEEYRTCGDRYQERSEELRGRYAGAVQELKVLKASGLIE